ncbi:MAG: hypothetical protein DRJ66_00590 [Thermoprotei archaeon]|nr:MAG: hypothetical protein DRJ66_00590 [Thermoprotei archaeon]
MLMYHLALNMVDFVKDEGFLIAMIILCISTVFNGNSSLIKMLFSRRKQIEEELPFVALMVASSDRDPIMLLYSLKNSNFPLFKEEVKRWEELRNLGYGPLEAITESLKKHPSLLFKEFIRLCMDVHKGIIRREVVMNFVIRNYEKMLTTIETYLPNVISLIPTLIITVPAMMLSAVMLMGVTPKAMIIISLITSSLAILIALHFYTWIGMGVGYGVVIAEKKKILPLLLPLTMLPFLRLWRIKWVDEIIGLPLLSLPIAICMWHKIKEISIDVEEWMRALRRATEYSKLTGVPFAIALIRITREINVSSKTLKEFSLLAELSLNRALLISMRRAESTMIKRLIEAIRFLIMFSRESTPIERFMEYMDRVLRLRDEIVARLKALRPILLISLMIYSAILFLSLQTLERLSFISSTEPLTISVPQVHVLSSIRVDVITQLEDGVRFLILISSISLALSNALIEDSTFWAMFKYLPIYTSTPLLVYEILRRIVPITFGGG